MRRLSVCGGGAQVDASIDSQKCATFTRHSTSHSEISRHTTNSPQLTLRSSTTFHRRRGFVPPTHHEYHQHASEGESKPTTSFRQSGAAHYIFLFQPDPRVNMGSMEFQTAIQQRVCGHLASEVVPPRLLPLPLVVLLASFRC